MWLTDNLWALRAAGTNLIQWSRFYAAHHWFKPDSKSMENFIFWTWDTDTGNAKYTALYTWQLCLSVCIAQQDPTSQIVICFLFAQPLVCKLLSVNQATNYTAAAAEWSHFYIRSCLELRKKLYQEKGHSYSFLMYLFWNVLDLLSPETETWTVDAKKTI